MERTNGVNEMKYHVGDHPDLGTGLSYSSPDTGGNGLIINPEEEQPKPKRQRQPWVYKSEYDRLNLAFKGVSILALIELIVILFGDAIVNLLLS
jgi:hypothetical protein